LSTNALAGGRPLEPVQESLDAVAGQDALELLPPRLRDVEQALTDGCGKVSAVA
jgi:hypothetical protein